AVVLILDMVEPGNSVTAAFIGHDPDFSLALWFIWALAVVDFWVAFRATPGKMLMRIVVVDADTGQSLTIWKAIVRFLAYIVSSIPLCLGFAWIAWDPRKQGWHDKIAGSVVVVRSSPLAKRLEKFPDSAMQ